MKFNILHPFISNTYLLFKPHIYIHILLVYVLLSGSLQYVLVRMDMETHCLPP